MWPVNFTQVVVSVIESWLKKMKVWITWIVEAVGSPRTPSSVGKQEQSTFHSSFCCRYIWFNFSRICYLHWLLFSWTSSFLLTVLIPSKMWHPLRKEYENLEWTLWSKENSFVHSSHLFCVFVRFFSVVKFPFFC